MKSDAPTLNPPGGIALVCGARPNFVKIAALYHALAEHREHCRPVIIHTGQHYTPEMSRVFFDELGLPEPDVHLHIGSGTHGEQTAKALIGIERYLVQEQPALLVCVGDVNSTLAAALAASKSNIPCAHVEAGLRSGDRTMPEEVNRVVADHTCDWLYTTTESAGRNLIAEGIDHARIVFAGNVMIDTLHRQMPKIDASPVVGKMGLAAREYVLLTIHRPANVDDPENARRVIETIRQAAMYHRVVFPVHPRTRNSFNAILGGADWDKDIGGHGLMLSDPLGYIDFLALEKAAFAVLTDSGGVQEETTALGVPCLTLRPNTERPITVEEGTNTIVGLDPGRIARVLDGTGNHMSCSLEAVPQLRFWDGHAAGRIVTHMLSHVLGTGTDRHEVSVPTAPEIRKSDLIAASGATATVDDQPPVPVGAR